MTGTGTLWLPDLSWSLHPWASCLLQEPPLGADPRGGRGAWKAVPLRAIHQKIEPLLHSTGMFCFDPCVGTKRINIPTSQRRGLGRTVETWTWEGE